MKDFSLLRKHFFVAHQRDFMKPPLLNLRHLAARFVKADAAVRQYQLIVLGLQLLLEELALEAHVVQQLQVLDAGRSLLAELLLKVFNLRLRLHGLHDVLGSTAFELDATKRFRNQLVLFL